MEVAIRDSLLVLIFTAGAATGVFGRRANSTLRDFRRFVRGRFHQHHNGFAGLIRSDIFRFADIGHSNYDDVSRLSEKSY